MRFLSLFLLIHLLSFFVFTINEKVKRFILLKILKIVANSTKDQRQVLHFKHVSLSIDP